VFRIFSILLALFLCLCAGIAAQSTDATLSGTVTVESDAVIAGATVTAQERQEGCFQPWCEPRRLSENLCYASLP